ncbi:MAG: response regulator [Planctomycetes bacterium]|nr:response regulator [Planctomycetota bacterium]
MSRILIVEDHQTLLRSIRRGLEALGHEILATETGEEGYDWALQRDVELVVLDVMLPGKSGIEILKELRRAGFGRPILILSAKVSHEAGQTGLASGANAFLAKPFAFSEFHSVIQRLLQQAASESRTGVQS